MHYLNFKIIQGTPNFMVINFNDRAADYTKIAKNGFERNEIINTQISTQLFALVDAVYMSNELIEIRSWTLNA